MSRGRAIVGWFMLSAVLKWLYARRAPLLVGTLIVVSVLVLYGRFLVRPADFFIGDLVSLFQPLRHQYAAAVSAGGVLAPTGLAEGSERAASRVSNPSTTPTPPPAGNAPRPAPPKAKRCAQPQP